MEVMMDPQNIVGPEADSGQNRFVGYNRPCYTQKRTVVYNCQSDDKSSERTRSFIIQIE